MADESSVDEAIRISASVDALLLDSGNPDLLIKELGGTGRVHDWGLSRRIREEAACPVFLAGGLKPENVRRAIDTVEPFAVDVCSRMRPMVCWMRKNLNGSSQKSLNDAIKASGRNKERESFILCVISQPHPAA